MIACIVSYFPTEFNNYNNLIIITILPLKIVDSETAVIQIFLNIQFFALSAQVSKQIVHLLMRQIPFTQLRLSNWLKYELYISTLYFSLLISKTRFFFQYTHLSTDKISLLFQAKTLSLGKKPLFLHLECL